MQRLDEIRRNPDFERDHRDSIYDGPYFYIEKVGAQYVAHRQPTFGNQHGEMLGHYNTLETALKHVKRAEEREVIRLMDETRKAEKERNKVIA